MLPLWEYVWQLSSPIPIPTRQVWMILLDTIQNGPQPYQCPSSKAHVWDPAQCERFNLGGPPSGGGGGGRRRGLLGRIIGGLTGGLL
ncbi:hypothetical protein SEA_RAELA_58 [Mycobacterium phage Raela]|uniref:Uncharacterized protein n=1 Tax=Mycobacterium phage Raela TaxID=2499054 RepID=A0A3S9U923_9CAUD|nr:hypothetical protein SEA_RAELA_58 [Mycobacterium phage Raela]